MRSREVGLPAAPGSVEEAGGRSLLLLLVILGESLSLYFLYKTRIHDPPSLYWEEDKLNDTLYGSS